MSAWAGSGADSSYARRQRQNDLGGASTSAQMAVDVGDVLDEEVGYLSKSVLQLKSMAREIGEETKRTGEAQAQLEATLAHAQAMMDRGVKHMKRAHRQLTSSCGHMVVFMVYIVAIILLVYMYTKARHMLKWLF